MVKAIAEATNGCAFRPKDHTESLHLFQMETLLRLSERLVGQRKPICDSLKDLEKYKDEKSYPYSTHPPRAQPGELKHSVTTPKSVLHWATVAPPKNLAAPSLNRVKRILSELASYQKEPHRYVQVFPCEEEINFWRLLMVGPETTPYAKGTFLLYVKFPQKYPHSPPEMRFITPIYHCNVNSHGKICHSIFDRNYSVDYSVRKIIDCVYGLLLHPEPDDPLDSVLAEKYYLDKEKYQQNAKRMTTQCANKSLKEWHKELNVKVLDTSDTPDHFLCPLSGKLMDDPVLTIHGASYCRVAIERALENECKDPLNGKPLNKSQLFPNENLRKAIQDYEEGKSKAWFDP